MNSSTAKPGTSSQGGKEKKTRRRLRLSCVECTKRRQKCDRQVPCGLCVSRNVPHLCRWENVPVARPAPARPPITKSESATSTNTSSPASSDDLSARIAMLERTVALQNTYYHSAAGSRSPPELLAAFPQHYGSLDSTLTPYDPPSRSCYFPASSPSCSVTQPTSVRSSITYSPPSTPGTVNARVLSSDVFETTAAFAQLSLARHGEYIGRGSVLCSLHSLGPTNCARFVYANSTDPLSTRREVTPQSSTGVVPNTVEGLAACLPGKAITMGLVQYFFGEANWRFGIPEDWFLAACAQMWTALGYESNSDLQINVHWLSLLFAVIAFAPQDTSSSPVDTSANETYLSYAFAARKLAENAYMLTPSFSPMESAADGAVLGCLADLLIASYISERGHASESWKIVGSALRNAIAVGMHRDPSWVRWQVMSEAEKLLRVRTWWSLVAWDRFYSFLLGRPSMLRRDAFDVVLPRPNHLDGTHNLQETFQFVFIQLSNIVSEAIEKCFNPPFPLGATIFHIDRKLQEWEARLPLDFRCQAESSSHVTSSSRDFAALSYYRYTLRTWYLACRLRLHRSHVDQDDVLPNPPGGTNMSLRRQSQKICNAIAVEILRLQCDTHDMRSLPASRRSINWAAGSNWSSEGVMSMFEASVAMVAAWTKYPLDPHLGETPELLDRAIDVFSKVVEEELGGRGEIARMALGVLTVLRPEQGWVRDKAHTPTNAPAATPAAFSPPVLPPPSWLQQGDAQPQTPSLFEQAPLQNSPYGSPNPPPASSGYVSGGWYSDYSSQSPSSTEFAPTTSHYRSLPIEIGWNMESASRFDGIPFNGGKPEV